jgi:hypothetical protein
MGDKAKMMDGRFMDANIGSIFNFFGRSVSGPPQGRSLRTVPREAAFWFAWVYSHPDTAVARFRDG